MNATRHAWRGRIKAGQRETYFRVHREIPQAMLDVLREAGIRNYTIWVSGDDVIGTFEALHGIEFARRIQAASPVALAWAETTAPLLDVQRDPATNLPVLLEEAFHMP